MKERDEIHGRRDEFREKVAVGKVWSLIDKLSAFREASASCIHIEARLEADKDLTD